MRAMTDTPETPECAEQDILLWAKERRTINVKWFRFLGPEAMHLPTRDSIDTESPDL